MQPISKHEAIEKLENNVKRIALLELENISLRRVLVGKEIGSEPAAETAKPASQSRYKYIGTQRAFVYNKLLERLKRGPFNTSESTALGLNKNSLYNAINKMHHQGLIRRIDKGKWELVKSQLESVPSERVTIPQGREPLIFRYDSSTPAVLEYIQQQNGPFAANVLVKQFPRYNSNSMSTLLRRLENKGYVKKISPGVWRAV